MAVSDLEQFAERFADLDDGEVMSRAVDVTSRLIDKSALLRLTFSSDAADSVDRIHRGLMWIRTVIRPRDRLLGPLHVRVRAPEDLLYFGL